ncbi:MAG: DUF3313 family protein [Planctomycetota bacterium]|nr:MAG: DUF3313 family protein [Planctomycetota bacterium]
MATMTSNCFSLARTALPAILLSVTVAALAACGSTAQQRIGFIPESVKLNEVDKLTRSWRSPTLTPANYTEIVVLPTTTPAFDAYGDLNEEQLSELRSLVNSKLAEAFATKLGAADGAAPRKFVIHAAITAIKPNNPMLNVAPQTQILKRGFGFASCEIYATDGESGPVIAAFMQTVDTQRFGTSKLSATGTAARAADEWAKEFRKMIAN